MDADIIYLRQLLFQDTGMSLNDMIEIQDRMAVIADKFLNGIIPVNETAGIAWEIYNVTLEYEINANEELTQLQEAQKEPFSSEVQQFINSHEKLKGIKKFDLEIYALKESITELKRLREMGEGLMVRIQDYSATAEYSERRRAFLRSGESPREPAPGTQAQEALSLVSSIAGYYPKFINHYHKLVKAGY
jgi:hypothetical protein